MPAPGVPAPPRPERLLVIAAHPGDADLAVAGSVRRWVAAGSSAHLVCGTSGESAATEPGADPLALAARREEEQRAAAALVGYEGVTFLHRPDGALSNDLALREQLVRIIRAFRPDALAAPDPRVIIHAHGVIAHTDHRQIGMAALDAIAPAASSPAAFPEQLRSEGLTVHTVPRLLLYWSDRPDAWVDVAETMTLKLEAVGRHRSLAGTAGDLEALVREQAGRDGRPAGLATAEAWAALELRPDGAAP